MSGKLARTLGATVAALLLSAGAARADSGLRPADAEKTLGSMRYMCVLSWLCPLSAANYDTLKQAIAGERGNQFFLGLNLISGRPASAALAIHASPASSAPTGWRRTTRKG
ncbi:MAG TPA: hypothetical protein VK681_41245 [Reyranella sp.]|nr:hypothetical protein [Reyranella sp.]